jgi:peroxiredoxin
MVRQGRVWLAFFRYATCPMCHLRGKEMMDRFPNWAPPEFQIIGVLHSRPDEVQLGLGRLAPPFPLLCDPERRLYKLYGIGRARAAQWANPAWLPRLVRSFGAGYPLAQLRLPQPTLPADFLINEGGRLQAAYYGRHIGDHIPFRRVEEWLGFELRDPRRQRGG